MGPLLLIGGGVGLLGLMGLAPSRGEQPTSSSGASLKPIIGSVPAHRPGSSLVRGMGGVTTALAPAFVAGGATSSQVGLAVALGGAQAEASKALGGSSAQQALSFLNPGGVVGTAAGQGAGAIVGSLGGGSSAQTAANVTATAGGAAGVVLGAAWVPGIGQLALAGYGISQIPGVSDAASAVGGAVSDAWNSIF